MKLTIEGIKDRAAWEKAGIALPGYDVEKVSEKAKEEPGWVHFGIGNIFRIFIGGIADGLLEEGVLDRGITCVETFDYDVVDKIYDPYDNLGLSVILHGDGTREYKVLGSLAEAVKAQSSDLAQWNRLKEIFASKSLQMVSFTITEKGYALQKAGSHLWRQISRTDQIKRQELWQFWWQCFLKDLKQEDIQSHWYLWITAPRTVQSFENRFLLWRKSGRNRDLSMLISLNM